MDVGACFSREQRDFLLRFLKPDQVILGRSDKMAYASDWTDVKVCEPMVVLLPRTTEETCRIFRYLYRENIPVVPNGGLTGLSGGGSVDLPGEVVVNLGKMNRILNVDLEGLCVEVEAGVTTEAIQQIAKEQNLFFPIDLAAKGSSQIGGNIATNVGGLTFIRYGGMREQVLGLEVVLPDGQLLDINTSLYKNNTGYDLKQLFIGSEGTLGVITKAILKLMVRPVNTSFACLATHCFKNVLGLLKHMRIKGKRFQSFEFFTKHAYELVRQYHRNLPKLFLETFPYYLLIEVEESSENFSETLEELFAEGYVVDGIVSESAQQYREIWSYRENITESLSQYGHVYKNDIALPLARLAEFVEKLEEFLLSANQTSWLKIVLFGHVGDGNIHLNYSSARDVGKDKFFRQVKKIEETVFKLLAEYRGSISAEHGIGILKRPYLHYSQSEQSIAIMKQIKQIFDPKNLMNPGKLL